MGQKWPNLLITTTHRPSEGTRSFSKVLNHIVPKSILIKRGSKSVQDLLELSISHKCGKIAILFSKGNTISSIKIYTIQGKNLVENLYIFKIYQYIDYKIFGWKSLPGKGPLSTSREVQLINKNELDFFEEHFALTYKKKEELWLLLDKQGSDLYIEFIDALTLRPFVLLRGKVMEGK